MIRKLATLAVLLKSGGLQDEADGVTDVMRKTKDPDARIAIFDFDGTLFRSPLKPPFFRGSWWAHHSSLPSEADESWWIPETVDAAKEAIANPDTLSVCLTGRQDRIYKGRVPYLLHDAGLKFDILKLSDSDNTEAFKSAVITELVRKHPFVSKIELWDDKPHFLERYEKLIGRLDPAIEVVTHHVVARSKPAPYEDPPPELPEKFPAKGQFIGVFLDSESKAILEEAFPAHLDDGKADHVTVVFAPTSEVLESMRPMFGKRYQIKVTGYAEDEFCQAVTVDVPGLEFPDNKIPHITVAVADGIPPKYSNELLSSGNLRPVKDLILSGTLWYR